MGAETAGPPSWPPPGGVLVDLLFRAAAETSGGGTAVPMPDLLANFDFQNGRQTRSDSTDCSLIRST